MSKQALSGGIKDKQENDLTNETLNLELIIKDLKITKLKELNADYENKLGEVKVYLDAGLKRQEDQQTLIKSLTTDNEELTTKLRKTEEYLSNVAKIKDQLTLDIKRLIEKDIQASTELQAKEKEIKALKLSLDKGLDNTSEIRVLQRTIEELKKSNTQLQAKASESTSIALRAKIKDSYLKKELVESNYKHV